MTPHRIRRIILDNGLRVLLAPDDATPAVGIAVHYAVGFRTEPAGRSGLAHLFEHLVFQGAAAFPRAITCGSSRTPAAGATRAPGRT